MGEVFKTKDEYISFLEYLMTKEEPVIDHVIRFGGLSRGRIDLGELAMDILRELHTYKDSEEVYRKIAMNSYWNKGSKAIRKDFSNIYYREDLEEYLISLNLGEDKAKYLAKRISMGGYKSYCRSCKKSETLKKYGTIHDFALATGWMGTWDYISLYFPTEVDNFLHRENGPSRL